jgi:CDP-diacylglycerol---glycerol-3-phosphate 3-phosphatidyltransferase
VEQAKEKGQKAAPQGSITLTDQARLYFKDILNPLGAFFNRLGLTPNMMTMLGLAGNVIGAIFLARGDMLIGGIIILLMGPVDALDGTMARLRGIGGHFGAFVDSVTDRYSELAIMAGLLYYYAAQESPDKLAIMLTFAAAAGSILVSYIRARGQSLNWDTKVGVLTRMERFLVLCPALILNRPIWALWIIAIFANITALQRIMDIRRQAYQDLESGK